MSLGLRSAGIACALLGGALAVLASADAWHLYDPGGFTFPDRLTRYLLLVLAGAILGASLIATIRRSPIALRVVAACAGGLMALLLMALLDSGGLADRPAPGAWYAGASLALSGIGAIVLGWGPQVRSRRVLALLALVPVAVAAAAVLLPPDYPPRVEVIR